MKTLADEIYLSEALEALSKCVTEAQVTEWDNSYCSNEKYMHLPTDMVDRLEDEYRARVHLIFDEENRKRIHFILGGLA